MRDIAAYQFVDGKEPPSVLRGRLINIQPPLTLTRADLKRLLNPGSTAADLTAPFPQCGFTLSAPLAALTVSDAAR